MSDSSSRVWSKPHNYMRYYLPKDYAIYSGLYLEIALLLCAFRANMYLQKGTEDATMKSTKSMTYKELEQELLRNRDALRSASLEQKRNLINRDHDLMVEMNSRWEKK